VITIWSLWLPILLSTVIVFLASSVIHMVLGYHNNDFGRLPAEDRVRDALRPLAIPPGEYVVPYAGSARAMSDPAFVEKLRQGPVAFITALPNEAPQMARNLLLWFVYCLVVAIFAAYLASRTLAPEADYLAVFRIVGCSAFLGYTVALWQNAIWYHRAWSTTVKQTVDGVIYALLTAGTFGWLWPAP